MKVIRSTIAISALGAVSAFSNNVITAPKRAVVSLSMLPKSRTLTQKLFLPIGVSLSTTKEASTDHEAALKDAPNHEAEDGSAGIRQLLGIKGASEETDIWKIRLQLTKPVTWIPLVWGVMCGAAASGNYHWIWNPFDPNDRDVMLGLTDAAKGFVAMILAGPFMAGYTQTINDWYDREIDAINEPYRPIPSGAISEGQVMFQIWFLLLGGLGIAYGLDVWAGHEIPSVLLNAIVGSIIAYIYSAPPLKLKQNGWAGDIAIGARTFLCLGGAVKQSLEHLTSYPVLSGWTGAGIVNDFKSIEGDRAMGLNSLPVVFGVDGAKFICAGTETLTQLGVAAYLYGIGEPYYALALLALILPKFTSRRRCCFRPYCQRCEVPSVCPAFLSVGHLGDWVVCGSSQL
ncbi:UbiA prenyltransferase family [Fragilaria crotonensis]|nr:UbiA prenyltransferase family [Fragilaria crotonensis]